MRGISVFFFFGLAVWPVGFYFTNQRSNPHNLQWKRRLYSHWTTREVLNHVSLKKIQSASLCILCKDFNLSKFTMIPDKEGFIFAILLCVFYIYYSFFVLFLYYCFDLCLIDFFQNTILIPSLFSFGICCCCYFLSGYLGIEINILNDGYLVELIPASPCPHLSFLSFQESHMLNDVPCVP